MSAARARSALGVLAVVATAAACTPAMARTTVSPTRLPRGTEVRSSYGQWTVWSAKLAGPTYVLLERDHGRTHMLPAPAQAATQDPRIGPDARGRAVAVYQRCKQSTCTIWRYDLAARTERAMPGLGHPRRSGVHDQGPAEGETLPTIWGANVAFQDTSGDTVTLHVGPSAGPGRVRTMRNGPGANDAYGLALGPRQLLIAWSYPACAKGGGCTQIVLDDLSTGSQRILGRGDESAGCITYVDSPYFNGHVFAWLLHFDTGTAGNPDDCRVGTDQYTYTPATGRTTKHAG